jgi:hypothetical protein
VLVLDVIEILPPLGKYKYDTWRILLVMCYIDNSVCLRSCIRNVNSLANSSRSCGWSKTLHYVFCIFLADANGDNPHSCWHFQIGVEGVECCFKSVEETPSEDGIVRIIHVHHIKSYVLSASITKAIKRYWFDSSYVETIQRLGCFFELFSIETHLLES